MPAGLPDRMRVVEISTPGPPDVLRVAERPLPTPGRGEVLIKVAAAGVNRPDVVQRQGHYPPPPGASDLPGLEVAGEVVALGPDVASPSLGMAVCALLSGGGYAEYCLAPAAQCLPIPDGLGLVEAAALPEALLTVWDNVFVRGRLQPGETLLVHGGTSGIGTTAIQLAAARGARVFATAGTAEKCATCLKLGAERAVDYRHEDFVSVLKDATQARGVDVILDMVGGDYTPRNLALLALEGRLVQIAFLHGSKVQIDLSRVLQRRLTLMGSTLRPRSVAEKAAIAAGVRREVWPLLETGRLRPVIHASFPLEQAAEAHRVMESSRHIGKLVLTT